MKIPRVRIMTFMQFLCNFGITGIGPILPLYIKQMMGSSTELVATVVGFIIFISGGCSAVMSLNVGRLTEYIRPHRILVGATFFVGFTFLMQYLMTTVTGLGVWRGITGLGMGLIAPCTNTLIAKSVPLEKEPSSSAWCPAYSLWATWPALSAPAPWPAGWATPPSSGPPPWPSSWPAP